MTEESAGESMMGDLTSLHRAVAEKLRLIALQREEIVTAFIAKYGCEPDECEQVLERDPWDGTERYYVRKKETVKVVSGDKYVVHVRKHSRCGEPDENERCICCAAPMQREECHSVGMQQLGMYWLVCPKCPAKEKRKLHGE